jgi:hypothetical protein
MPRPGPARVTYSDAVHTVYDLGPIQLATAFADLRPTKHIALHGPHQLYQ